MINKVELVSKEVSNTSLQDLHKSLFSPNSNAVKGCNSSATFEIYSAYDYSTPVRFASHTGS